MDGSIRDSLDLSFYIAPVCMSSLPLKYRSAKSKCFIQKKAYNPVVEQYRLLNDLYKYIPAVIMGQYCIYTGETGKGYVIVNVH